MTTASLMMVTQLMMAPERTPGMHHGNRDFTKSRHIGGAQRNSRFFDAGTDISQNGGGGTDGIGHSPHRERNNHDQRRSGKDNRRFIESKDESDTEDGTGNDEGEHRNDVKNAVQCISFPHGKVGDKDT